MKPKPKPPEILRKSHRHSDRKERAAAKEELRHELDEIGDEPEDDADVGATAPDDGAPPEATA